jgi:hypothetical protein
MMDGLVNSNTDRAPPNRHLDKAEAVRHLLHAAVRMFAIGEDPFAIHLLIQSAEKLLIDLAKNRGIDLAFDWETVIKAEYRREFFKMYRETYNFFKHADKDTTDLPVHNISEGNAVALTMAIENYKTMFGTLTEHMKLFRFFARLWKPKWFSSSMEDAVPEEKMESFKRGIATLRTATPAEFFNAVRENREDEALESERKSDVSDAVDFYSTRFEDMTEK